MIHTKSLLRRLAFVPWLLALGLVVGWTGTADAQQTQITLSLGTKEVREDSGTTEISVTAESAAATSGPVHVILRFNADADPLNQRFRMTVPTIIIPKGDPKVKGTGTITVSPVDDNLRGDDYQDNGALDDLDIVITGQAGPGYSVRPDTLTLIDDDKLTRNMYLKFDPGSLSKEAESTDVDVTVSIDGAPFASSHSFDVVFKNTVGDQRNDLFDKTPKTIEDSDRLNILVRDSEYRATSGKISLSRRKKEGSGTITLDPFNVHGHVAIEAAFQGRARFYPLTSQLGADAGYPLLDNNRWQPTGATVYNEVYRLIREGEDFETTGSDGAGGFIILERYASNFLVAKGIDLNSDGDTGDVFLLTENGFLRESALGLDVDGQDGIESFDVTIGISNGGSVSEEMLGIDLDGDGLVSTTKGLSDALWENPSLDQQGSQRPLRMLVEKDMPFGIMVRAGFYEIKNEESQLVKDVKIAPTMMREEEGEQTFDVTVTLERKRPEASRIQFEIEDATEEDAACPQCVGTRDIHYTADIAPLTIPPQSDTGTTQLTVVSVDNNIEDGAKIFQLVAKLGESTKSTLFTIADDELPTTQVTLSASPSEVTSGTGEQEVAITATINGKVFDEDLDLTLILDHNRESPTRTTAERDIDFDARVAPLTIKAGDVTGSSTVRVVGFPSATGDLTIGFTALEAARADSVLSTKNEDEEDIKLAPVAITLKPAPVEATEVDELALADLSITEYRFTAGMSVSKVLPEATGGSGMLRYGLSSNLPAGLVFDSATRTVSGTPTEAGESEVVYTVIDSEGTNAATLFTITIDSAPPPSVVVSSVELSQMSVREGSGTVEISVTARLAAAAPVAETIRFTLVASGAGKTAERDVDFTASLVGNVPIEVGAMQASTTLMLTAVDNGDEDGNRFLAVQASGSGGSASADIKIADDETASTAILLSATPNTVGEEAGVTDITVTATLDGQVRSDATAVVVSIDPASSATRDEDYVALFVALDPERTVEPIITIPANSVSGSVVLRLSPARDGADEGNESITLVGMAGGLASGSATITLADYDEMMPMMDPLAFAEGSMMIADIHATAGEPIDSMELPAAMDGSGEITYSVSDLPAGLMFDAATRMLSGTPEEAGTTEVTYTATDEAGDSVSMTFTVMVAPMLDFSDLGEGLFGALNGGAGKRVPLVAGLNTEARLYLAAPTVLPSVGEDFVLDVSMADFVAIKGYGLQVEYDADKLAFVEVLGGSALATRQVRADDAGVLTVVAHGDVVSEGELALSLVFRAQTEIEGTVIAITDNQTYDGALGFNRLALPAPVQVQTRPESFALADNFPNPFNPATTIQYALPQAADVELTVYNVVGQPVRTLVAEHQSAGRYAVEWDATNDSGHSLSSGMYFYRLQAGGEFHEVKKMLLLK